MLPMSTLTRIYCTLVMMVTFIAGCAGPEVEAIRVIQLGNEALRAENYPSAVTLYREARRLDPSVRGPRENLALLALRTNRLAEALSFAKQATAAFPEAASPRLVLGWVCLQSSLLPCVWESLERLSDLTLNETQAVSVRRLRLWARTLSDTLKASDDVQVEEPRLRAWMAAKRGAWGEIREPASPAPPSTGDGRLLELHAALRQGDIQWAMEALKPSDDALLAYFVRFHGQDGAVSRPQLPAYETLDLNTPAALSYARLWLAQWAGLGQWGRVAQETERLNRRLNGSADWALYAQALAQAHLGQLSRSREALQLCLGVNPSHPEASVLLELIGR